MSCRPDNTHGVLRRCTLTTSQPESLREILDVDNIEQIILPALDPRADQVLGDAEVDRREWQVLEQNLLRLCQQLRALGLVVRDRGLFYQPVIVRVGERGDVLRGRGLPLKQEILRVVIVGGPPVNAISKFFRRKLS